MFIGMNTQQEQFPGFAEAYKIVKKLGFQNYFCMPGFTWLEVKDMVDSGEVLFLSEDRKVILQEVIELLIKEKTIKVDETWQGLMSTHYKNQSPHGVTNGNRNSVNILSKLGDEV